MNFSYKIISYGIFIYVMSLKFYTNCLIRLKEPFYEIFLPALVPIEPNPIDTLKKSGFYD